MDNVSGRPFRMRADHSWPQRRQLYHATIQVLSVAGSTGRPQTGHDIVAVMGNDVDMQASGATFVPCGTIQNGPALGTRERKTGN